MNKMNFCGIFCLFLTCLVATTGCQEPEKVTTTEVARSRTDLDAAQFPISANSDPSGGGSSSGTGSGTGSGNGAETANSGPGRIFAAMISRPEATYFLKALASQSQLETIEKQFQDLATSLTFEDNSMQWKLPEGWTQSPGGAMFRIATLKSPDGIEVAITSLTPGQDLLMNVNRWRGQIGLPPTTAEAMDVTEVKSGQQTVIVYDKNGPQANNSMTPSVPNPDSPTSPAAAPTSPGTSPSSESAAPAAGTTAVATPEPFEFPDLDEPWEKLEPTAVAVARWQLKSNDARVKLEVFQFPSSMAFASMAEIWAGRAELEAPSAEAFQANAQAIKVAGQAASLWQWPAAGIDADAAAATAKSTNALRIARVDQGENAWYFKLEGPADLVVAQTQTFQKFLAEVKKK